MYGSDNCILVKSRLFQDEQPGKCEINDEMNLTTIIHPSVSKSSFSLVRPFAFETFDMSNQCSG